MPKTSFIVVGTGNRGLGCFAKGLLGFPSKGLPEFKERSRIAALVDTNRTRGRVCAKELGLPELPVFATIKEAQLFAPAEWAIITTPDYTHCACVCEALGAGINVMVDKPLATSVMECDQIIAAMQKSERKVVVGHNYRYAHNILLAKKLVLEGRIGKILQVESAEILSLSHGGDYYHRWHSDFSKSAGLMNHKCCHFLDIICWILDDEPVEVSAMGARSYYTPRPELLHAERCTGCGIAKECPHYFDMDKWDGVYRRMYLEAEPDDGYVRDLCVFSDRHTVNDHESLSIRFKQGALCSFAMTTFAPREYSFFHFTGTKGRLEVGSNAEDGKPYLRVAGPNRKYETINVERDLGEHEHGHGGADIALMADILGLPGSHPLQKATPYEARRAVSIADMAARSIAGGGRAVKLEETGKDYPPAPPKRLAY
ncbi:MAG: Gfo/Idh/MocA family oxidoreductase [Planctomycetes bacterium]|nr:Gfo/Idh/MocA family oxidoreductase [Planctomycetota bacterium]